MAERTTTKPERSSRLTWNLARLRRLYAGNDRRALRLQLAWVILDTCILAFFLYVVFLPPAPWITTLNVVFGIVLAIDLAIRLAVAPTWRACWRRPHNWLDCLVILSAIVPAFSADYNLFRILGAFRLIHAHRILTQLRPRLRFVREREETLRAVINFLVFVFMMTALVYVTQRGINPDIAHYVDALYFTVTSLTTTGYGDITLKGQTGRLLAVVIMVLGVSLFFRLAQTVLMPNKVYFPCPDCGLERHDRDSVHCRHCGRTLNIPDEGHV
ncbi:potassium channel family protein [Marinivivus vitaminiproducens]|uniref:potassium channel family protein n=1 Tax=Marinivivus vitaminiproducens TaxID=3035935 RepID=UPI00279EA233|nr:ion transporter [Geminicoccaceae bacterium SCSIO 64248]